MDAVYYSERVANILALFLQDHVVNAYHLDDEDDDDPYVDGELRRIAASVVSEIFVSHGTFAFGRLIGLMNSQQIEVCHGYTKDEYILCGGEEF